MSPATLILASRSPRRAAVLREAGYVFTQDDPPFHDPPQPEQSHDPAALATSLAARKAISLRDTGVLSRLPGSGGVILAADTLCVDADNRVVGQPADIERARQILLAFMDRGHRVMTGVALLSHDDAQPEVFADVARVFMHAVPGAELQTYLDTQQWRGKAGGYNLFDRQAAGWSIDVQGDPTTVVGLPMVLLVPRLRARGVIPLHKPSPHHEPFQA